MHFLDLSLGWGGAKIGNSSIIVWGLAKKANSNLEVGCDTIIETAELDLRNKIIIGNHCIINDKVEILRVSHNIDNCTDFSIRYYPPLVVGNYSWLATGCKILPSCCNIGDNVVIGAYSVVVADANCNCIYSGFPARLLREKNSRFEDLLVTSMKGGDFSYYRKGKRK